MDKVFLLDDVSSIVEAEEATFTLYHSALKPYVEIFAKHGVSMTIYLSWNVGNTV